MHCIDDLLGNGSTIELACREVGASIALYYKWRQRYEGMSVDDAKELKELRTENSKLKRLVAEAELEKMMLREIAKGKFSARLAQQRNAELFCCSETLLGHQNGLRAKLLGSPGQSSAGL